MTEHYPIGTAGQAWGEQERKTWLVQQQIQRSYRDLVLVRLLEGIPGFARHQYGSLSVDPERYPLLAFTSEDWRDGAPCALITGGVHGYETSGVIGAVRFLTEHAQPYLSRMNLIVAPCISPWGFETVNRWNPAAIDPNRSFYADSPAEESAALMAFLADLNRQVDCHIDLHETTDTDATEFRPALAARDGKPLPSWEDIPDGFYLVGDARNPEPAFQRHIIQAVEQVTAIAPPDANGDIIGEPLAQHGVINYEVAALSLCAGVTGAPLNTTTEVYPDSPRVDAENCIRAQVTAIQAALDYLLSSG